MGCVSSALLSQDDDFSQIGGSSAAFAHHIVSLKSTTYGLLTLDPPPPPSATSPASTATIAPKPDIINSWELMAGLLDSSTPPPPPTKPSKENSNPNLPPPHLSSDSLDGFEKICPPNGEDKVVIYTTTLRGIRKTFEACNSVRSAIEGLRVEFCERDISMDRGFREELRQLLKGKGESELVPPRLFVKGRYIGGAEQVLRIAEDEENGGALGSLLRGLPRLRAGHACEGCGGGRFLPCFRCNGSCKMVVEEKGRSVVVRCSECNENGLVLCPICS